IGIALSLKVVTGLERRAWPELVQPGDREWVTVIQSICAAGYATPPFIIYKGRVHISAYNVPHGFVIAVSKNGWTINKLRLQWLKHFNKYTKRRQYCKENKIITICMPLHSSHLLQPLDIGCFAPLKKAYRRQAEDLMRN
ncbi:DDE-domain-containing protein, partial [Didymella exigua CBS 183.55]